MTFQGERPAGFERAAEEEMTVTSDDPLLLVFLASG